MSTLFLKGNKTFTIFNFKIIIKNKASRNNLKKIKVETAKKFKSEYNHLLYKNLRHLEFINYLEMNYKINKKISSQSEFIQKIEGIKYRTEHDTLDLIKRVAV